MRSIHLNTASGLIFKEQKAKHVIATPYPLYEAMRTKVCVSPFLESDASRQLVRSLRKRGGSSQYPASPPRGFRVLAASRNVARHMLCLPPVALTLPLVGIFTLFSFDFLPLLPSFLYCLYVSLNCLTSKSRNSDTRIFFSLKI